MRKLLLLSLNLALASLVYRLPAADIPSLTYSYRGYDSNSVTITTGTLNLRIDSSNRVTGTWEFKPANAGKKIGPQTGSGKLRGSVAGKKLKVDLNPDVADNNIWLEGMMTATNLVGTWVWYGFAGRLNGGTFDAVTMRTSP